MSSNYNNKHQYKDDPNRAANWKQISGALFASGFKTPPQGIGDDSYDIIYEKHLGKFHKLRVFPMVKKHQGRFPHMDKTKAIIEFIARGFIHEDTADIDMVRKAYIKCKIAPLVWPEEFDTQAQAFHKFEKIGIPGYTGVVYPKN